jgi:hypothetical protein
MCHVRWSQRMSKAVNVDPSHQPCMRTPAISIGGDVTMGGEGDPVAVEWQPPVVVAWLCNDVAGWWHGDGDPEQWWQKVSRGNRKSWEELWRRRAQGRR